MADLLDLVVEDGTGKVDSNTYVSDADAAAYHDLYGNMAYSSATDDERATSLVNATQYLDLRWQFHGVIVFPGTPTVAGQALCWPRDDGAGGGLFDSKGTEWLDEVPTWIENATYEYALAFLVGGRLLPDPTVLDPSGQAVTGIRSKVGPIEEEITYNASKATDVLHIYAQGDRYIRESGLAALAGGGGLAIRA